MSENRDLENELWDDESKETKPIYHRQDGGRVFWIQGEEFRCIKCGECVPTEDMDMEEELRVTQ